MQGLNQFLLLDAVDHGRVLLVPVLPLRLPKSGYGLKWSKVHGSMETHQDTWVNEFTLLTPVPP